MKELVEEEKQASTAVESSRKNLELAQIHWNLAMGEGHFDDIAEASRNLDSAQATLKYAVIRHQDAIKALLEHSRKTVKP